MSHHSLTAARGARVAAAVVAALLLAVPAAQAHTTGIHDNCTNLNDKWPHGVGLRKAKDETTGEPVTNFTRNNRAYRKAVHHNSDLDRDKDKIACEKH